MKIKPLGDRIVVERIEEEEVKKGGIIIPDTAKEKPQRGRVLAVGPGRKTEDGKVIPVDVNVGDIVIFSKYAGTEVEMGDQKLLIMREDEILGIIEE
ncbi:MAG: co-chaperone GroES [candidate division WOR-3 bacterium]|nr:co-chaperone GroES [candidate division WOR-3 bacterium]MCX7948276.1 co-chaperone GroES [candidate division WOR-3 bacterium]MDW8150955.1 co-chaperone GroES [candidate division WOR-3 bacterium]